MPYKRSRSGAVRSRRRGWKATPKNKGWGKRRVSVRGRRISQETTFNKTVFREDFVSSGLLSDVFGVINFKASLISDFGTLAQVYDQYRINYITVTFIPKTNVAGVTNTGGAVPLVGLFGSAIDFDTSTARTAMSQLAEYNNFKFTRGLQTHSRTFRPRPQTIFQAGALTTPNAYFGSTNPWIDCNQADVDHYGLQFGIADSNVELVTYDLMIKVNISLKNVH